MAPNANKETLEFWIEMARVSFEEDLHRLMERAEIKRTDLARAAGVSAAYISKILNGSTNYTLKTMAKLGRAVDAVLQVRLIDEGSEVVRIVSPQTAARLDDSELTTAPAENETALHKEGASRPRLLHFPTRTDEAATPAEDELLISDSPTDTQELTVGC